MINVVVFGTESQIRVRLPSPSNQEGSIIRPGAARTHVVFLKLGSVIRPGAARGQKFLAANQLLLLPRVPAT